MRAFLLAPIAFVAAVSASNLEQRSPFHAFSSLAARADIIDPSVIPDKCKSSCSTIVSSVNSCASVECLCTNKNGQSLKTCVDCLVKEDGTSTSTATGQSTLDSFVSSCQAAGVTISNLSVGGSSSSASNVVINGGALAVALASALAYLL
ncbi:hypothetical protein BJ322DRAFT_100723 [Thelephora terrestris]|uniref:Extracellular membrane protein CFEM domain-containing protein n=1 Tax=Thelephora terrestris TaxID=56493 RepID=A0A9P6HRH8_9AGAM|nr:hypothetical protein BJ322DRAFT_100723 [Thelephora terrestris]